MAEHALFCGQPSNAHHATWRRWGCWDWAVLQEQWQRRHPLEGLVEVAVVRDGERGGERLAVLVDHAHCERKAAGVAVQLMF